MPKKQPWSSYGETIHTHTQQSGCHSSKLSTGVSFGTCSFEILADSLWHECMGLCHSSMGALLWAGNTASWQPWFLLSEILDFTHLSSKSQINKFCGLIFHAKAHILSRNFYFVWGFSPQIFYPLTWILHFHYSTSCSWSVAEVTSDFLWPHGLCSPPASSVHGIFQARILEGVAISFFRESSQPRDQTFVSIGRQILTEPPEKFLSEGPTCVRTCL